MKLVVRWLGVLLVGCIVLRLAAQLIAPVIPLLVALFAIAASAYWIFGKR